MVTQFLILTAVSYGFYLCFDTKANPFSKPKLVVNRRKWRLARGLAGAAWLGGALMIVNLEFAWASVQVMGATTAAFVGILVSRTVVRHMRTNPWASGKVGL